MNIVDALKIGNKLSEADAAQQQATTTAPAVENNSEIDAAVQKMSQGIQASVTEAIKPVLDEIKKLQTGIENLVNNAGKQAPAQKQEQQKPAEQKAEQAAPQQEQQKANEATVFSALMKKVKEAK